MASTLRVVVASAHGATRAGVRQAIEEGGLEVCGEAADVPTAVELTVRSTPDCSLLGLNLPGDPLPAVHEIATRSPATTVVMLAENPSPRELLHCIRAGAAGYLPTSTNPDRLAATMMDACNGGAAIPRSLVSSLVAAVRTGSAALVLGLPPEVVSRMTKRELEVLELLRGGESTDMIAALLSISPVTVRRHVSSIVEKLGVPDRQGVLELLGKGADAHRAAAAH